MNTTRIPYVVEEGLEHTIEAYIKRHPQYAEVLKFYAKQYPSDAIRRAINALKEIGYKF